MMSVESPQTLCLPTFGVGAGGAKQPKGKQGKRRNPRRTTLITEGAGLCVSLTGA